MKKISAVPPKRLKIQTGFTGSKLPACKVKRNWAALKYYLGGLYLKLDTDHILFSPAVGFSIFICIILSFLILFWALEISLIHLRWKFRLTRLSIP